ncbi:restriction endonuclease subunit S [Thalassobius sp. Cn5-15]|uniref:restriction endonuclease subunit S n=1 Tax=Thalassobius sp. Cn5-15 TaxID=2917763 RepID=UPI001EF16DFC|nr:restriction endonuclease subunit S [Thalassobius sp. Cn5-15]MCG7495198.1 restriction endonuclease subunit S [Thalassobius sp. Cn5-15]
MITRNVVRAAFPVQPLGEVVEFLDHMRRPVKQTDRIEGDYPYFGANGQQGTIDGYIFDEPLVLVAEDGGHFANPDRGIAYQIEGKSWVNNHAHVLRPKPCVDISFLTRVLENYDLSPYISGTTRAKLTKGQAAKIEIPLPTLEEQKRIAGILDQADALRRLRTRALDKLNTLGQAIFHEMFGDPGSNPYGWDVGCIGDLLEEAKYGTSSKANAEGNGLPILRMGNVTYDGRIDLTDLKHIELSERDFEKYTTKRGDLLFNRTNSKELVGKSAVVKQEEPLAIAGYLVRARANANGNTDYISGYLNSPHGKATLMGMCKNIVGMANINAKEFQRIKIALPPKDLQDQYANRIDKLEPQGERLLSAVAKAGELFFSLQHRAFRGELLRARRVLRSSSRNSR